MPKYYFPHKCTIQHHDVGRVTIFSHFLFGFHGNIPHASSIFSVFHANLPRLVSHQEHNVLGSPLKFKELIPVYLSFHVSGPWPATLGSKQHLMGDSVLCVLETS